MKRNEFWVVQIRQDNTAFHTFQEDESGELPLQPLNELVREEKFLKEREARDYYFEQRAMLRFRFGQYVTYPERRVL